MGDVAAPAESGFTSSFTGGKALMDKLNDLAKNLDKGAEVRIGFLEGATYPDGTSVAMVAAIQNWGAPAKGIPPRPFFSNMIAKESPHWGDDIATILKSNDYDAYGALDLMGHEIEGALRQSIIDTNSPALSPVTLYLRARFWANPTEITFSDVQYARDQVGKGVKPNVTGTQAKPLVWTGRMLGSVSHETNAL